MKNDKCNACSGFPTGGVPCEPNKFTSAVVEINNPKECPILFHKVVIPVTMGDETSVPPEIGKYRNVLLVYEINNHSYLYSSDGVPTRLNNGITNYEEATNLPQINGVTLRGNKSAADLNLADAPMVITVADGNTSWSGADTAEDVYNFFLNKGKVNIIFNGGENYAYEIASAAYIPEEEKMMCTLAVATIAAGETAEFEGNALFGTMTLYTADKAIDVSQIELQPKLFVTDFTGLDLNYNELSGVPATTYSIGMVKPGSGLSVDSNGTLSADGAIIAFDTVADMKLSEDLSDGAFVETYGFYAKGDGGGAKYKVRELTNADTVDESTLIALSDDEIVAELELDGVVNLCQFGAKGDGASDDTSVINIAITYAKTNNLKLISPKNKTYLISDTIDFSNLYVDLNFATLKTASAISMVKLETTQYYTYLNNIMFDMNESATVGLDIVNARKCYLKNLNFINATNTALYFREGYEVMADTLNITGNKNGLNSIGMRLASGDSHWSNIIIIDMHTAIYQTDNSLNFYDKVHAWLLAKELVEGSAMFKFYSSLRAVMTDCYSDTYYYTFYVEAGSPNLQINNFICIYAAFVMTAEIMAAINDNPYLFYFASAGELDGNIMIDNLDYSGLVISATPYTGHLSNRAFFNGRIGNAKFNNIDKSYGYNTISDTTRSADVTAVSESLTSTSTGIEFNAVYNVANIGVGNRSFTIGTLPWYFRSSHDINYPCQIGSGQYTQSENCYLYISTNGSISLIVPDTVSGSQVVKINSQWFRRNDI